MEKKIRLIIVLVFLCMVCCCAVFISILKKQVDSQYDRALILMNNNDKQSYIEAIQIFSELGDFRESLTKSLEAQKYLERYTNKENIYNDAMTMLLDEQYLSAIEMFRELKDFEDSEDLLNVSRYNYALKLFENGEYTEASQYFLELGDYEDSEIYAARAVVKLTETMQEMVYNEATSYYRDGCYLEALAEFEDLGSYKDSIEMAKKCIIANKMRQMATTIVAGSRQSTAIQVDGKVVSTVNNSEIQKCIDQWEDIVSISFFGTLIIGLKKDGTVVTAGKYDDNKEPDVSEWENIVQIVTGQQYVVGLKADGTVVGAGHKDDGQLDFSKWENIICIAAGWRHTVGLDKDGNIHVAGYRAKKYMDKIEENKEDWTNIIAIAAGGGYDEASGNGHIVGLRDDGTVVAVGDNTMNQCDVEKWDKIVAIAAGDWHTIGLREDGSVVATGWLGGEKEQLSESASSVEEWKDIVAISAGAGYSIGLTESGEVVAVGYDTEGAQSKLATWGEILTYNEWKAIDNKTHDNE